MVALPRLLSLLPPPLILLSSSLSGSGPSIYFRSLSVAFVEYFVSFSSARWPFLSGFCTRRERASKPQEISLGNRKGGAPTQGSLDK